MSSVAPVLPAAAEGETGFSAPVAVSFTVQACAEPGVMPRVLELFAKRGLVPRKWHSTAADSVLTIEVQIGGMGRDTAEYVANCMRRIAGVETVLSSEMRF